MPEDEEREERLGEAAREISEGLMSVRDDIQEAVDVLADTLRGMRRRPVRRLIRRRVPLLGMRPRAIIRARRLEAARGERQRR
jgi:hypothetical protein